jgi:acetyl-CoA carboxylase carboxyl transferase subunit alpha
VDEIVPEPEGGAHRDYETSAANLGAALQQNLTSVRALSIDELLKKRYQKFRDLGNFAESKTAAAKSRS